MAKIARAAKVADGTLYTYYCNKESLAYAVIAEFFLRLITEGREGVHKAATTEERLRFLARFHQESIMEEYRLLEMLPLITQDLDVYMENELFGLNKTYAGILTRIVEEGQARGDIRQNLSPWILRDIFFGGLDYGVRAMILRKQADAIDHYVDEIVGMIMPPTPALAKPPSDESDMAALTARLEKAAERVERVLGPHEIPDTPDFPTKV